MYKRQVIRVSVDHGTAFDIAGKNLASEASLAEAVEYAVKMVDVYKRQLVSIVNESMNSGVLKFIKGERSMDEWDAFLAEMDGLGYDRIVEIEQEAYDAMYK